MKNPVVDLLRALTPGNLLEECRSLFFLCKFVLSEVWLDKFNNMGVMHRILCDYLERPDLQRKILTCFRGSYKTTMLMGYIVWLMIWSIINKKPVSVVYNTASKDNAEAFNLDVRNMILESKLIKLMLPWWPTKAADFDKWSKWKVQYKWFRFDVASLDTRQVSRHYTVIINDDLVNDDNAFSETEREKIKRKWKYQKSILTKYKKLKVGMELEVGTPYHKHDLMAELLLKKSTYVKCIIPYEIDGELTFPEMYTWEDFEEILEDQGPTIFSTQYKLVLLDEQDVICKEEWLQSYESLPRNRIRVIMVDPAGTEKEKSSVTAIMVADFDETGNIDIIYAKKLKVTPFKLIKVLQKLKKAFDPDHVCMELEKYSITIKSTVDHFVEDLDIELVSHGNKPKPKRIAVLQQWYETGRIFHNPRGLPDYTPDLLDYPDVKDTGIIEVAAYLTQIHEKAPSKYRREYEPEVSSGFDKEFDEFLKLQGNFKEEEFYDAYF